MSFNIGLVVAAQGFSSQFEGLAGHVVEKSEHWLSRSVHHGQLDKAVYPNERVALNHVRTAPAFRL